MCSILLLPLRLGFSWGRQKDSSQSTSHIIEEDFVALLVHGLIGRKGITIKIGCRSELDDKKRMYRHLTRHLVTLVFSWHHIHKIRHASMVPKRNKRIGNAYQQTIPILIPRYQDLSPIEWLSMDSEVHQLSHNMQKASPWQE